MINLSGKRLLLQGASRGNLGLIKTAKKDGVFVVMTGLGGDFPCNQYADKICLANIVDCEAVLKIAREEKVDGAIICCSDTGLPAIGHVNDFLGLSGITEECARLSVNKAFMKERLIDAGIRTARYHTVRSFDELVEFVELIGLPVIIKAIDLQGSRGINIVRNTQDLNKAYLDTMSLTRQDYCIVEQYIEGKEYGAQAFVFHGEVLFVLPHGDDTIMRNTAVPVGHFMPYDLEEGLYEDTIEQVTKAISALGINNTAVNVDLIEKEGKAYIIEITGRVGANCLPELTSFYYGINYYDMILTTCLGENPITIWNNRTSPCSTRARMIFSDRAGVVKSLSIPSIDGVYINMFIHEGSEVRIFSNSNDAIGEIAVKGKSLEECGEIINSALSQLIIEYF